MLKNSFISGLNKPCFASASAFRVLRADVEALFQIDLTAHRTKEALLLSPLHIARSVFHKDLVYVQYLFTSFFFMIKE